jgi:hypothetical protein
VTAILSGIAIRGFRLHPSHRQLDNPPINSANISKQGRSMNVEPRRGIAVEILAFVILLWSVAHAVLGVFVIVFQSASLSGIVAGMALLLSAAVGFLVSMGLRRYWSEWKMIALAKLTLIALGLTVGVCIILLFM